MSENNILVSDSSNVLSLTEDLASNEYPGRGLMLGTTPDGTTSVLVYFIMGRSENSRNRVFVETEDGIRTEAFDPSKCSDPSLIIYHPIREYNGKTIVTNGDQTDTIRDALADGMSYIDALRTCRFEPDAPNFTSRISGVLNEDGSYDLSILKYFHSDPDACKRYFFEYDKPVKGRGHFLHTYLCNGDPLPFFLGEPKCVFVEDTPIDAFADSVWEAPNEQNKISLFVRYINMRTGEKQTVIKNKLQK